MVADIGVQAGGASANWRYALANDDEVNDLHAAMRERIRVALSVAGGLQMQ